VAGQLGRGNCRTLTDALTFLRTCPRTMTRWSSSSAIW
jgi:hypothetical protein